MAHFGRPLWGKSPFAPYQSRPRMAPCKTPFTFSLSQLWTEWFRIVPIILTNTAEAKSEYWRTSGAERILKSAPLTYFATPKTRLSFLFVQITLVKIILVLDCSVRERIKSLHSFYILKVLYPVNSAAWNFQAAEIISSWNETFSRVNRYFKRLLFNIDNEKSGLVQFTTIIVKIAKKCDS